MKQKRFLMITAAVLAGLAAPLSSPLCSRLSAQVSRTVTVERHGDVTMAAGPGAPVGGATTYQFAGNNVEFIAAAPPFGGEVIKNAPYSAEAVTETEQTLADGNKISHKNSSMIYRDSQGRTRREEKLGPIGPWASSGEPAEMIFINDPVAGVNYVLNAQEHTAQKLYLPTFDKLSGKIEGAGEKGVMQWHTETSSSSSSSSSSASASTSSSGPGLAPIVFERRIVTTGAATGAGVAAAQVLPFPGGDEQNVKTESLGSQMIEGVQADGTRTTVTIPAGQIGNEKPIEIVSEQWQSPQLNTLVLSKNNDPRFGETTYRLTNVQLVEPLPSLFEVPADYTVEEDPKPQIMLRRQPPPPQAQGTK